MIPYSHNIRHKNQHYPICIERQYASYKFEVNTKYQYMDKISQLPSMNKQTIVHYSQKRHSHLKSKLPPCFTCSTNHLRMPSPGGPSPQNLAQTLDGPLTLIP